MPISIRRATQADLDAIYEIWCEGARLSLGADLPKGADYKPSFAQRLERQDEVFGIFVAEDESGVIGWVSLAPFRSNPATTMVMAEASAYTRLSKVRDGIGKRLFEHVLAHAETTPLQYVNGFISSENDAAMRLVTSVGFRLVAHWPPSPKSSLPPLNYVTYVVPKRDSSQSS